MLYTYILTIFITLVYNIPTTKESPPPLILELFKTYIYLFIFK